jgi:hypothetical protein
VWLFKNQFGINESTKITSCLRNLMISKS